MNAKIGDTLFNSVDFSEYAVIIDTLDFVHNYHIEPFTHKKCFVVMTSTNKKINSPIDHIRSLVNNREIIIERAS